MSGRIGSTRSGSHGTVVPAAAPERPVPTLEHPVATASAGAPSPDAAARHKLGLEPLGQEPVADGGGHAGVGGTGALRFKVDARLGDTAFRPTAEVQALLAKYEPDGVDKLGRPLERVLQVAHAMDAFIMQEYPPEKRVDLMMQQDLRKNLFQMEALLRLYEDRFGKSAGKPLEQVKALEDALGTLGMRQDQLKAVAGKPVPPRVLATMHQEEAEARAGVQELVQKEWLPDPDKRNQVPVLNKLIKHLCKQDWPSYEKDKQYLCKQVAEHIHHVEKKELDMDDLQGGIHELRRQLRWIPLFMLSAGGVMQLDETRNPLPQLAGLLKDKEASSPFARMPDPARERDPVAISKSLYVANSKLIAQLGNIKDRGEVVEYLAQSAVKAGLAKDVHQGEVQARRWLGRSDTDQELRAEAKALYRQLHADGLLKALRQEFQR